MPMCGPYTCHPLDTTLFICIYCNRLLAVLLVPVSRSPPRGPCKSWLAGVGAVCAHVSYPFCLLINVNRLNVAWETCGISLNSVRERPDYPSPVFMFSWLPALQLGFTSLLLSWNFVIWVKLRWVEEFIYNSFLKVFGCLRWHNIIALAIFRLAISLPTHCTVPSCFFFHTLLLLAIISRVWKAGEKVLIEDKCYLLCLYYSY